MPLVPKKGNFPNNVKKAGPEKNTIYT